MPVIAVQSKYLYVPVIAVQSNTYFSRLALGILIHLGSMRGCHAEWEEWRSRAGPAWEELTWQWCWFLAKLDVSKNYCPMPARLEVLLSVEGNHICALLDPGLIMGAPILFNQQRHEALSSSMMWDQKRTPSMEAIIVFQLEAIIVYQWCWSILGVQEFWLIKLLPWMAESEVFIVACTKNWLQTFSQVEQWVMGVNLHIRGGGSRAIEVSVLAIEVSSCQVSSPVIRFATIMALWGILRNWRSTSSPWLAVEVVHGRDGVKILIKSLIQSMTLEDDSCISALILTADDVMIPKDAGLRRSIEDVVLNLLRQKFGTDRLLRVCKNALCCICPWVTQPPKRCSSKRSRTVDDGAPSLHQLIEAR